MLPPGRARFSTKPALTGSTTWQTRSEWSGSAAGARPLPGSCWHEHVGREGDEFRCIVVGIGRRCRRRNGASIRTLPSSVQPKSRMPLLKAPRRACPSASSADRGSRTPTRGTACFAAPAPRAARRRRAAEERDELAPSQVEHAASSLDACAIIDRPAAATYWLVCRIQPASGRVSRSLALARIV